MDKKNIRKLLKILLIVFLIVVVLFLINTFRKFFIIKELQNNFAKFSSSQNYHIKSVAKERDGVIVTINYYTKGSKKVSILERDKNGEISKISMYDNGERTDTFWDNAEAKKAKLNSEPIMIISLYNGLENDNNWFTFIASIYSNIKKTTYNGKECYVINNFMSSMSLSSAEKNEIFIEKATGLMLKNDTGYSISEREYEFDNVSDAIFEEPDIGQYTLMEKE